MYSLHDLILRIARPTTPRRRLIQIVMRVTQQCLLTSRWSMAYQNWWWDKRYAKMTLGREPRSIWRCWLDLGKYFRSCGTWTDKERGKGGHNNQ